ncbi:tyrosine-type recombinase/integrase [Mucilaginibacter phyllosphaerae]|uniref:Integrase n=1 Tax=Mucilaginibacter phyllosphaerae TaxID=1812349 RepID=A0A4Y8ABK3_9SPHI|nr:site-specific integrase [Mucilaginibacter phyllosphaerae]MBB3969309.1 integrase [Mucilaginibacter phyllosphaerae]TEW65895.1 site-specific integrase [Mucilaginibacter phyllosphaerae]GGH07582.1 integrase [Mucilaginibacter phyllosphaerae]
MEDLMDMTTVSFTKDVLDKLEPTNKRYSIADTKIPYLKLFVYESGAKSFVLTRKVKGRSQKIKIGNYDTLKIEQARKKAKDLNALIDLGGNPHQDRIDERQSITFKELYEHYYSQHALRFTKHPRSNRKIMEFHVLPSLGHEKASAITSKQMRDLHSRIGEKVSKYSKNNENKKSHGNANRVLSVVNAVFNFGIKEELIDCKNPCFGLKKYKSNSRDRFLSPAELIKFFEALNHENQLFSDLFKILLFTGARKTNVLSMKWTDIDLDLKRWRIPESQTKNKDVNIVVLPDLAIAILKVRYILNEKADLKSQFVFPGEGKHGYLNDPKKSFYRIKKFMGVDDITIHDLRRTMASYMAISGASLPMIGKALNHKSQVSTAIYARLSQAPVLDAVNVATSLMNNGYR